MPKSIIGGWRAFSLLVQAAIGTAQPANTLLNFEGDPMEPEPNELKINDTEVTGELLPTQHRLLNLKFAGKHKSKAFPHVVGLMAAQAMGKDTPTQVATTTAYRHKIEIDKDIVELPYRTMVENDGSGQARYVGVACAGFTLSGKRGDYVEFEADLVGTGGEEADATAKPARIAESYMAYGDVTLTKGGAYDGTQVTGGVSIAAELVDFKLTFKNNGKAVYLMGDGTGKAGQIRRGAKYEVEFEATIEFEDGSHRTDLLAGNEFVLALPIVGGVANGTAHYGIEAILPRVFYREAKKGVDDGILKLGAKFGVLADPVYGPFILNVINLQQASYLAAA
jgi:hypothetical protein